jgi:hypothetical protein
MFGDLFQGLKREAFILTVLDPRDRLLTGTHKLCHLLLRQSIFLAELRSQLECLPFFPTSLRNGKKSYGKPIAAVVAT